MRKEKVIKKGSKWEKEEKWWRGEVRRKRSDKEKKQVREERKVINRWSKWEKKEKW